MLVLRRSSAEKAECGMGEVQRGIAVTCECAFGGRLGKETGEIGGCLLECFDGSSMDTAHAVPLGLDVEMGHLLAVISSR